MKRYPKYKESGVPWLGEIPYGWVVRRARFLCSIGTGSADTEDKEDEAAVPFYVRSQTVECISKPTHSGEAILTAGDGAGVGKVYHHHRKGPFAAHQRVYVMQGFRGVSGRYFYYAFSGMFSKVALDGGAKSTVDSLRRPMLTNFFVALPSLSEQERITVYLDSAISAIDAAISSQERMIELLKERRSAIITQAVTKGLDPKAKMKDSGVPWLGAVNQLWKYLPLKQVVSRPIQNGLGESSSRSDENDPRYIRITDIGSDGKLRDDTFSSVPLEDCKEAFVVKGDILCAAVGGTVGKSYLHQLEGAFCYAGYLVRIRPEASKVTPRFVKYWTESKNYWSQIEANLVKVTIENFSASRYSRTYMPLPTVDEQNIITDYLDDVIAKLDATIASQEQMIELLKERRSAIITQAVTGQIDVR